jgi:hypothetical protein
MISAESGSAIAKNVSPSSSDALFLNSVETLTHHIEAVFGKQKGALKSQEELLRVEQCRHFDSRLVARSLRNPRFLEKTDRGFSPKKVYSISSEYSLDTYENRFVVALLDSVSLSLESWGKSSRSTFGSLGLNGRVSFEKYGSFRSLSALASEPSFLSLGPDQASLEAADRLGRLLSLLRQTPFYQSVPPLLGSVKPTNLLLSDPDYRFCYDYRLRQNEVSDEERGAFLSRFMASLQKEFRPLAPKGGEKRFEKGFFAFSLSSSDSRIVIKITNKPSGETETHSFSYLTKGFLPFIAVENAFGHFEVPIHGTTDFGSLVGAFAFSLRLGSSTSCPVCGAKLPLNGHFCQKCHLPFSVFGENGDNYLWIHNLPFRELGGNRHE